MLCIVKSCMNTAECWLLRQLENVRWPDYKQKVAQSYIPKPHNLKDTSSLPK